MTRPRAAALTAALACAGCQAVERLPAPDRLDLKAIVLGHLVEGAVARIDAVPLDTDDDALPPFSLADDARTTVVAIGYACPLEALGLEPGALLPLSEPLADSTLPYPLRAQLLTVDGDSAPTWATVGATAPEVDLLLRSIRVTVGTRCGLHGGQLTKVPVRIPPDGPRPDRHVIEAAIALGDGRALVVTSTSGASASWVVSADGDVRRVELRDRARGTPLPADTLLAAAGDGALWAITLTGSVARGTIEAGFEGVGHLPEGIGTPSEAIADREDGLLVVVTSGEQARLLRWGDRDTSEWVRVGVPSLAPIAGGVLVAGATFSAHPLYLATRSASGWSMEAVATPVHATTFAPRQKVSSVVITTATNRPVAATIVHDCRSLFCRDYAASLAQLQGGVWTTLPGGYRDQLAALSLHPLGSHRMLVSDQALFDAALLRIDIYDPAVGVCLEANMNVFEHHGRPDDRPDVRMRAVPLDEERTLVLPSVSPDDAVILVVQESSRGCAVPL